MPWYPRDIISPSLGHSQSPSNKPKSSRRQHPTMTSQLSTNPQEAEAQLMTEAQQFAPNGHYGLTKESLSETTLRRYQGALEEWHHVLHYSGEASPGQDRQVLEKQLSAIQQRLSLIDGLMNRNRPS